MATATFSPTGNVVLGGVPWEIYDRLRSEESNRNLRMTYCEGTLQMMSPSKLHERIAHLLGRFVDAWTEECEVTVQGCGATTFRREDLQRGLEPDRCYYVQHEPEVRGRDELDLSRDPPPDLAIEVDIHGGSDHRMAIYAALGVPEVWRWKNETLEVFSLTPDGGYTGGATSRILTGFPLREAVRLVGERNRIDETRLVRLFRSHVRAGDAAGPKY
jgi:Uma2 family endonuclease